MFFYKDFRVYVILNVIVDICILFSFSATTVSISHIIFNPYKYTNLF